LSIFQGSRYENSKVYKHNNAFYIGSRKILKKKEFDDNIIHVVRDGERLELIAYNYWKMPEWWYIICDWNDIFNPFLALEPGTILVLPSFSRISGGDIYDS